MKIQLRLSWEHLISLWKLKFYGNQMSACLAMCQITRGLRYIAFKWAASENSAATANGPKRQCCTKSLECMLHILGRFSYFTHCTPTTTAVKMTNNPPLIFTHLWKCIAKLHENNTCDEFFILHFLLYSTESASADIRAQGLQVCARGFPVRHHTDILWTPQATGGFSTLEETLTFANLISRLFISLILSAFTQQSVVTRETGTINCKTDKLLQYKKKKTFTNTWFNFIILLTSACQQHSTFQRLKALLECAGSRFLF